jgi:hypothetical protein
MIYKCNNCSYITTRKSDLLRHEIRKTPCYLYSNDIKTTTSIEPNGQNVPLSERNVPLGERNVPLGERNVPLGERNVPLGEKNVPLGEKNVHDDDGKKGVHDDEKLVNYEENMSTSSQYCCTRCKKELSNYRAYNRHIGICKGYNSKTCGRCFKEFSSCKARWKHMNTVKCNAPSTTVAHDSSSWNQPQSIINNTTNINTINNIDNSQNVNIQLNFGEEMLEKLCNQPDYIQRMEDIVRLGKYALPQHISDIYFNNSFPMNNTIMKTRHKDRFVKIKTGENEWNLRAMDDVYKTITERMESYMTPYFTHVEKQLERIYDEDRVKFKKLTRCIREFGHKVLWLDWKCDDIRQIGVELNEPYCENERHRRIQEMKTLLLEHIYDKTRDMLYLKE